MEVLTHEQYQKALALGYTDDDLRAEGLEPPKVSASPHLQSKAPKDDPRKPQPFPLAEKPRELETGKAIARQVVHMLPGGNFALKRTGQYDEHLQDRAALQEATDQALGEGKAPAGYGRLAAVGRQLPAAMDLVGSITSGGLAAKGLNAIKAAPGIVKPALDAAKLFVSGSSRTGKGFKAGAQRALANIGSGAVAGAADAEPGHELMGGVLGAGLNALPGIAEGLEATGTAFRNAKAAQKLPWMGDPEQLGRIRFGEMMSVGGDKSVSELGRRLEATRGVASEPVARNLSDEALALVKEAQKYPTDAAQVLRNRVRSLPTEQTADDLGRVLGVSPDYTVKRGAKAAKEAAQPDIAAAFANVPPKVSLRPELSAALDAPEMVKHVNKVRKDMYGEAGMPVIDGEVQIEFLQAVNQRLSDKWQKAFPKSPQTALKLLQARHDFMDVVDRQVPEWALARAPSEMAHRVQDAISIGESAAKGQMDPLDVQDALRLLTEGRKERLMAIGAIDEAGATQWEDTVFEEFRKALAKGLDDKAATGSLRSTKRAQELLALADPSRRGGIEASFLEGSDALNKATQKAAGRNPTADLADGAGLSANTEGLIATGSGLGLARGLFHFAKAKPERIGGEVSRLGAMDADGPGFDLFKQTLTDAYRKSRPISSGQVRRLVKELNIGIRGTQRSRSGAP